MGWSDNSVLKALATLERTQVNFQHPLAAHNSVTLVLEYPTLSLVVSVSGSMQCTLVCMFRQNIHVLVLNFYLLTQKLFGDFFFYFYYVYGCFACIFLVYHMYAVPMKSKKKRVSDSLDPCECSEPNPDPAVLNLGITYQSFTCQSITVAKLVIRQQQIIL